MRRQGGPISIAIDPSLEVDTALYFDLQIESEDQQHGLVGQYHSCDQIIAAMDFAAENPRCGALWERYYRGEIGIADTASACTGGFFRRTVAYPPSPDEVVWAKDKCVGSLKRFVVDYEVEVTPTTGDIGLEVSAVAKGTLKRFSAKKPLARRLFFIGWVPVLVTVNGTLDIDATYDIDATALSMTFDPLTVDGLLVGGGVAYYASSVYDDGRGVLVSGQFEPFSKSEYGSWHATPLRLPHPSIGGLPSEQDLTIASGIDASLTIGLRPGINLLLYDLAGPFVQPASLYGELRAGGQLSASVGGDARIGLEGTCSDDIFSVCARAGIEGHIGLDASALFDDATWKTDLYGDGGSCSDFCPLHDEAPFCVKTCFGLSELENTPVEIELRWLDPSLDLDLEITAPFVVDYQDTSANESSGQYQHEGDVCPAVQPLCVDEPDTDGYYREIIRFIGDDGPGAGVRHVILIETYLAMSSGAFEVVVRQNAQEVESWRGDSGTTGTMQTFEFVTR